MEILTYTPIFIVLIAIFAVIGYITSKDKDNE